MTDVHTVISAASGWTLSDGTVHPTRCWAEEVPEPHRIFTEAGWRITIATPGGAAPTLDELSLEIAGGLPSTRRRIQGYLEGIAEGLTHPVALLIRRLQADRSLALQRHAPAAILAVRAKGGAIPFTGRWMTGFSNAAEPLNLSARKAPWPLEDRLREAGVGYEKAPLPMRPHVVVDRNLVTNQTPACAQEVAMTIVTALGPGE